MEIDDKKRKELHDSVNRRMASSNIAIAKRSAYVYLFFLIFALVFIFNSKDEKNIFLLRLVMVCVPVLSLLVCSLVFLEKGKGKWIPYALISTACLCVFTADLMSSFTSKIIYILPITISTIYYDKRLIYYSYYNVLLMCFLEVVIGAYFYDFTGMLNLNMLFLDTEKTVTFNGYVNDEFVLLDYKKNVLFANGLIKTFIPNMVLLTIYLFVLLLVMDDNQKLIVKLNEETSLAKDKEKQLQVVKTKLMLSQVKPHFIYNTLNSIAYLCDKDGLKAKKLVIDFAKYLRDNLDSLSDSGGGMCLCTFKEELEHIQSYLNIEKVRFADELNIEYDIQEDDFVLPALSIQPLVENSVKHGICKKINGGTIKISSYLEDNRYVIRIEDNGIGFKAEEIDAEENHIGLNNVKERLSIVEGKLEINSQIDVGTIIKVYIPCKEKIN